MPLANVAGSFEAGARTPMPLNAIAGAISNTGTDIADAIHQREMQKLQAVTAMLLKQYETGAASDLETQKAKAASDLEKQKAGYTATQDTAKMAAAERRQKIAAGLNPDTNAIQPGGVADKRQQQMAKDNFQARVNAASMIQGNTPEEKMAILRQKDPNMAEYIDAAATGQIGIMGRMGIAGNLIQAAVTNFHPDFDSTKNVSRQALRNDFTSGKSAVVLNSANTLLHHIDNMGENGMKLDTSMFRRYGTLQNILKNEVNDPQVKKFMTDLTAVSGEAASTFSRTVTQQEIDNFKKSLSLSDSPQAVKANVQEFMSLVGGRTQPYLERWKNTFGDTSTFPVIGKSAMKLLNKWGYNVDKETGEVSQATGPLPSGAGMGGQPDQNQGLVTTSSGNKFRRLQ